MRPVTSDDRFQLELQAARTAVGAGHAGSAAMDADEDRSHGRGARQGDRRHRVGVAVLDRRLTLSLANLPRLAGAGACGRREEGGFFGTGLEMTAAIYARKSTDNPASATSSGPLHVRRRTPVPTPPVTMQTKAAIGHMAFYRRRR